MKELTYRQTYKNLISLKNNNHISEDIKKFLYKHGYINNVSIVNSKGDLFIKDYGRVIRKIEYTYKDYDFIGSLALGILGGIIGYILIELVKKHTT